MPAGIAIKSPTWCLREFWIRFCDPLKRLVDDWKIVLSKMRRVVSWMVIAGVVTQKTNIQEIFYLQIGLNVNSKLDFVK